ncbi:MAG: hypothetical protein WC052_04270 [Patescibacteria group bacterium]
MKKHDLLLLFLAVITILAVNVSVQAMNAVVLTQATQVASKPSPVDTKAYQNGAAAALTSFVVAYQADSKEERVVAITNARTALLALRVPMDLKDVHLDLVLALDALAAAEAAENEVAMSSALAGLRAISVANPWLAAGQ